jgi:hypothetical protein
MKNRSVVLASVALTALAGLPAVASSTTAEAPRSTSNLELVNTGNITGRGGTDIEFFSRTLDLVKNRDGDLVPSTGERHFAFVGNQVSGASVVDITEPEKPYVVSTLDGCKVGQGDTQVNKAGTLGLIASQTSGTCRSHNDVVLPRGSIVVDLRNPYEPKVIGAAPEPLGSHNHTLHPDGRHLFISTSELAPTNGENSRVPIYDLQGWENWESAPDQLFKPVKVKDFMIPVNGPHDIRFRPDGKRGYFAGISTYNVVNTENPANPSIISRIVPPGGSIGHDTLISREGRFLFLGDEAGGGGTFPCPGGAVYVYDLANEAAPVLLGLAEAGGGPVVARNLTETTPTTRTGGCTSHVMELNPDGKSFTIGWYTLGTRVFSFASFYNADGTPKSTPSLAAAWGSNGVGLVETAYMIPDNGNTWSAKQYAKVPGYIFSDDINLGLYVSKIK